VGSIDSYGGHIDGNDECPNRNDDYVAGIITTSSTACGRSPLSDIGLLSFFCYGIVFLVDIVIFISILSFLHNVLLTCHFCLTNRTFVFKTLWECEIFFCSLFV
jgi:hypothetical protein